MYDLWLPVSKRIRTLTDLPLVLSEATARAVCSSTSSLSFVALEVFAAASSGS